jgi:hypothetical protein
MKSNLLAWTAQKIYYRRIEQSVFLQAIFNSAQL